MSHSYPFVPAWKKKLRDPGLIHCPGIQGDWKFSTCRLLNMVLVLLPRHKYAAKSSDAARTSGPYGQVMEHRAGIARWRAVCHKSTQASKGQSWSPAFRASLQRPSQCSGWAWYPLADVITMVIPCYTHFESQRDTSKPLVSPHCDQLAGWVWGPRVQHANKFQGGWWMLNLSKFHFS
jgi:hypothetical protein